MAKIWYLDLPDPNAKIGVDDQPWVNIRVYHDREQALKDLRDTWGIPKECADLFLTEGEE